MFTHIKNSKRGFPSSDNKNSGLEKEVKSWISRAEDVILRFRKYGAQLDKVIMSAGYKDVRVPDVVATIE